MEQALRFKAMYSRLGFTVVDVARFLQVTPRTVHAWLSGRVRIPYAAYKLLRVQLHYELPGDSWQGWYLSAGRLYTPEGHELNPHDFTWWGLLVRKAAMFSELYAQSTGAGRTAPVPARHAKRGAPAPAKSGPLDAVGRPAQPAGPNSFLEHFRKWEIENGLKPPFLALKPIAEFVTIPQYEKEAVMARKRTRQFGGSGGGSGARASRIDVTQIVQEEVTKLKRAGKWKPVGSPLLHGLLGRSQADVVALAAQEWAEVTGGAGVVLVDGKPVDPGVGK